MMHRNPQGLFSHFVPPTNELNHSNNAGRARQLIVRC